MAKERVNIVTAFYDIGRGSWEGNVNGQDIPGFIKRSNDEYFERFARLCKLDNPITVFTQRKFSERIRAIRNDIKVGIMEDIFQPTLVEGIKDVQTNKTFLNLIDNPSLPEYWSPEYIIINLLKGFFVNAMISKMSPEYDTTAWIDFGYCRDNVELPGSWEFDTNDLINVISNGPIDVYNTPTILEIIKSNMVFLQGCHIIAPNNRWQEFYEDIFKAFLSLISVGLVDDDQTLLLMAYRNNPMKYRILEGDSSNWFKIFQMNGGVDEESIH